MESAFGIIAEPNRRAILSLLASSERSVSEIEDQLRMSQPSVSKHLRVLRDAGFAAGALLRAPNELLASGLEDLSNQLDADLALYSGGVLSATSAPILQDLALVEPLLDPRVFLRLGLSDDLALTRNGTTYMARVRVGYRVVRSGPPGGVGILAAPQVADDWFRAQSQRDLAFVIELLRYHRPHDRLIVADERVRRAEEHAGIFRALGTAADLGITIGVVDADLQRERDDQREPGPPGDEIAVLRRYAGSDRHRNNRRRQRPRTRHAGVWRRT